MTNNYTRTRMFAAAVVMTLGWGLSQATAGLPDLPPFVPPPVHTPPPVVTPPPPIDTPPPVAKTPEPATLILGAIGAGIGGIVARRRKRCVSGKGEPGASATGVLDFKNSGR